MAGALSPVHLQGHQKQGKSSEEFDSGADVYQGSVLIWLLLSLCKRLCPGSSVQSVHGSWCTQMT